MNNTMVKPAVLVVDDVPENIDILAGALDRAYDVKIALNGEEALAIATSSSPPALILLDIMMPGIDGYEVCRRLKQNKKTSEIPVIFVTGMGEMEDEAKGFAVGGVDYITKPIRTPLVLARVNAHIELKNAREALKKQNRILKENLRLREDVENIVRHDMKTPINVFMWAPAILTAEGNLSENQLNTLNIVKQAAHTMLQMLNSSVNILKMERGEYTVTPAPVNVLKVLKQVRTDLQGLARSKKLTLESRVNGNPVQPSDVFIVEGEDILFYSMLSNLVKNAMEASPHKALVTVSFKENDVKNIRIHNNGAVTENIREQFFDKYITSEKKIGTGLGTYSARLIVETLGGSIRLDTSEREETTISISFPK